MESKNNTFKSKIIDVSKNNVLLRKIIRKLMDIKRKTAMKIYTIGIKVDDKTIFFSSFQGREYACSPKAIYEYMISNDKYKDYKYIWSFKEPEKYSFLTKNKNTKVVKQRSKEFEKGLAKSKYWIVNSILDVYIKPKKNQVYVQCWHGTPLKKLGCDLKNTVNAMNSEEEIHKRYIQEAKRFNFFISPSKFATEKFTSAWNLKMLGKESCFIEEGYPRNDFLYNFKTEDVIKVKEKLNIPSGKKVILYAPTWRDNQHNSNMGYTYKTEVNFDLLKEKLQNDYIILFRAHYLVANSFDFEKYKGFIYDVSRVDDINDLYIISDMLITDYSSVFFDYANLKRPIVFYMYDFEEYRDELRGFYIDIKELPGKITKTETELIEAIDNTKEFIYDEKYRKFNEKFNYLDDGQAAKRVVEKLIKC